MINLRVIIQSFYLKSVHRAPPPARANTEAAEVAALTMTCSATSVANLPVKTNQPVDLPVVIPGIENQFLALSTHGLTLSRSFQQRAYGLSQSGGTGWIKQKAVL